jgi:hypothetical protein
MLVAGSWLGLGADRPWTKEEHYKLARIRIDVPNSMDLDWKIDVKKSVARPPEALRSRLKELADVTRKQAREVFAHRGRSGPRSSGATLERAWKAAEHNGRLHYRINREHPVVHAVLASNVAMRSNIEAMLRVIEETVPVQQIWLDTAERAEGVTSMFSGASETEVRKLLDSLYGAMLRNQRLTPQQAKERLSLIEPFNAFPALIAMLNGNEEVS